MAATLPAVDRLAACTTASDARRPLCARPSTRQAPTAARARAGMSTIARVAASAPSAASMMPTTKLDWDNLPFGIQNVAPFMFKATCKADGDWQGAVVPYGNLEVAPAAQVLNYGQAIFEGMKAQRAEDGSILLFRPELNAERMRNGAKRMAMRRVPEDVFVNAIRDVVRANAAYVPPFGKGALYLRPLLIGSGPILGLGPAPEFTFLVFCAPVGSYFKSGQLTPIDLLVEEQLHRSAPRGMGGTKAAGNYSPVLVTQLEAKKQGFADVLYLDAKHDKYLEEVASCNIFVVKGDKVITPPTSGSILPGVTRRSILELVSEKGYQTEEAPVAIEEALEADEVFTTGTAVVVASVGSITYKGRRVQFGNEGEPGKLAKDMYDTLTGIQTRRLPDAKGWVMPVWEAKSA